MRATWVRRKGAQHGVGTRHASLHMPGTPSVLEASTAHSEPIQLEQPSISHKKFQRTSVRTGKDVTIRLPASCAGSVTFESLGACTDRRHLPNPLRVRYLRGQARKARVASDMAYVRHDMIERIWRMLTIP